MLVITPFKSIDLESCLAIRIKNYELINQTPEKIPGLRNYFLSSLDKRKYFVVKENERIVGFGGYQNNQLYSFFVDPDYQGKGIGKLLLDKVLGEIERKGYKDVILHSSIYGKTFYEKFGFVVEKDLGNEYLMKKIF